ncbi:magnesium transporter [Phyllobacterium phragmitis]|uniref:Magnesium transporter MgtE n=1 Tax=Phyllobacterium phragmitis TaxID=2670329 RepID=A0A2S9IKA2_9HYPH|nr:magnesium transporter [Phyllobacterium phragmitis]PRD40960.1 magnesium transporter [Phyllobacterium phragmitis]
MTPNSFSPDVTPPEFRDIADLPAAAMAHRLAGMRPADAIEILNDLDIDVAIAAIAHLPHEQAVRLLDQPELRRTGEILEYLPLHLAGSFLDAMSADRVTDIFQELEDPTRTRLFAILGTETKAALKKLLHYPPDTAGSLMTTEFISVPAIWTVSRTLKHIREVERTRETVYAIYVVDPETKVLQRVVTLRRLITSEPDAPIISVGRDEKPVAISPLTDREDVARLFRKHDLLAVPVVGDDNHVIGIVTVDDVLDAMTQEMTEDAYKFGGLEAITKPYMEIGFVEMLRKRGGWLCVLFLSEMLTASAMQYFEVELEKAVVLALFIPLVMSSGGNSGSQATSLLIRALALQDIKLRDWWKVALRELPTGVALGALLGIICVIRIATWQMLGFYDYGPHWMLIAATIAAALVGIVTFGSLSGSMLPFILQRLGFDPASASAPFVATLVDVTGLVIYFSVALIFLSGTLL